MRRYFSILTFFLLLYPFCRWATDGFSERMIHADFEDGKYHTQENFVNLDQSFFYLGHGAQTFAFLSEDGRYILKFYRHNRFKHPLFFLRNFLPPTLKTRLIATHKKRQEKRVKDFTSYLLAYEKFKEDSGLVALHLNPTPKKQVITLFDKIGVCHNLDLSKMHYILQVKADPLYEKIDEWIAKDEIDSAKEQLSKLVNLVAHRCKVGLSDKDPDLKTNFGFTKQGPIQFDVGRFKLDPSKAENYQDELIRIFDRLCNWLTTKSPELVFHIQKEIEKA